MPLGEGPWATYDELKGGKPAPGGSFVMNVGGNTYTTPTYSPQQQAALNWLQGSAGLNTLEYNSALSRLSAQRAAAGGAYGAAARAANRGYGLTIRGIDQDLMYGNQLRDEERYRNVDLGRERSLADYRNAFTNWGITNADLMKRWVLADRGFNLDNYSNQLRYNIAARETGSDAIARGARTAAGTIAKFGELAGQRDIGFAGNQLALDTTRQGLTTEGARAKQSFEHAKTSYGIDLKTFDSLAKTYGIQAAQAAAQAALAKERAAASRDATMSGAAAARNQALANLPSANSLYTNYMRNQMGLMQQLLAFR